jgi:hypothetical protein
MMNFILALEFLRPILNLENSKLVFTHSGFHICLFEPLEHLILFKELLFLCSFAFFRWKWENVADILDTFAVLCILSSFFRAPITITFLSKLKNFRFPKAN